MKMIAVIFAAVLMVGCADREPRPSVMEKRDIYARHAGSEIEDVRFASIRNWQPAGFTALAMEFGPRRHYLFTVTPPCEFDLQFVPQIRLLNRQPNVVNRFDRIQVGEHVCRITSIRPLDMEAVREDLQRLRQQAPETSSEIEVENAGQDAGGT